MKWDEDDYRFDHGDDEPETEECRVILKARTHKAIIVYEWGMDVFDKDYDEYVLPLSQIECEGLDDAERGDELTVTIPVWLGEAVGLL